MNYIESTKSEGEEIIQLFSVNKWVFLGVYLEIILGVVFFFVGSYLITLIPDKNLPITLEEIEKIVYLISFLITIKGIYDYLILKSLNMGITNKRVVYKKGIIGRKTNEIRLDAIETVDMEQSIMARLLGYGTVSITGKGDAIVNFKDIDEPLKIKRNVASAINNNVKK